MCTKYEKAIELTKENFIDLKKNTTTVLHVIIKKCT